MQRCLFFVFFLILMQPSFLKAQDVTHYLLDFYIESLANQVIEARAEVSIAGKITDSIQLNCSEALRIRQVRWREGRIKGALPFRQGTKHLSVQLPTRDQPNLQLVIDYQIDLNSSLKALFVEQNQALLALNPSAMYSNANVGFAGLFFPAVADDKAFIDINITHPPGQHTRTIGKLEFTTVKKELEVAAFWGTEVAMNPALFYLLVGKEDDFDPKELDELYAFTELSEERLLSMRMERELNGLLPYLRDKGVVTDDAFYARVADQQLPEQMVFFLKPHDVQFLNPVEYSLYAKAFMVWKQQNEAASQAFTQYVVDTKGAEYYQSVLQEKWQTETPKSKELLKQYAALYVEENSTQFPEEALKGLQVSLQADSLPTVRVQYRYVGSQNEQHIYVWQDTSIASVYALPMRYQIASKDNSIPWTSYVTTARVVDTLKVPLLQAPNAVQVSFGNFFPGTWVDEKPDNYSLYQLNNATSSAERQAALEQLFSTKNQNLYSTVVGIALRDESAEIRALALEAAEQLNPAGAMKLKTQLLRMAQEEPNSVLKAKANALVSKYYGG
jgi:hypothetical protein